MKFKIGDKLTTPDLTIGLDVEVIGINTEDDTYHLLFSDNSKGYHCKISVENDFKIE